MAIEEAPAIVLASESMDTATEIPVAVMAGPANEMADEIVRPWVRKLVKDVLAWQQRRAISLIPSQHSLDEAEAKLGKRFKKLLMRRSKARASRP